MIEQMDLFEADQVQLLRSEISKLKNEVSNLRRGIFARHNELERFVLAIKEASSKDDVCLKENS